MKTTELNGTEYTLTEGEGGEITLTPIIKQPDPRTPEPGDVWALTDWIYIIDEGRYGVTLEDGTRTSEPLTHREGGRNTYLGKHRDVYAKISDIIDALSFKDHEGEDMFTFLMRGSSDNNFGRKNTVEAFRKLNIIKD